ncbi:lycopene cyclase [Nocardia sp. SYP-A9097]|uniref:lycopene cyclase family protein n=1 Tax=Nocardia sp. SYP-A9097 TaxID=2663237 RepID=UPI001325C0E6|nr:lycopene cyclase family protein [Nocardia sp. SYP-A9097]MRH87580.1 lycopene cyclase [Nocardia sp. SYP-A9097]
MTSDLVVCGAGPAGRTLAHRALAQGQSVTVIDPRPGHRWTATYAAWADELPDWVPPGTLAATVDRPAVWTTRRIELDRRYVIFDTAALQDSLDLAGVRIITDRVVDIVPPTRFGPHALDMPSVRLASGPVLPGGRVIDARGIPRSPKLAEQTAYGVMVDRDQWPDPDTFFMDWRDDNGADSNEPRSFLYAVPLSDNMILLEETCLAGRPALDPQVLRERLIHRLRSRGITLTGDERIERVRFPVEGGKPRPGTFGAAGALTHPATGYSVAAALRTADTVAAGDTIWTPSARAVNRLRQSGLRALLSLPPQDLPLFFDTFFALSPAKQRAYLSARDDLPGTAAAMASLFAALPWRLRRHLASATVTLPRGV